MIDKEKRVKSKFSPVSLGLAFGVTEGLFMMIFGWVAGIWGYGLPWVDFISKVYIGYNPTFLGGIVGGLWGLLDGFVFGIVAGWFYNLFLHCCCGKSRSPEEEK